MRQKLAHQRREEGTLLVLRIEDGSIRAVDLSPMTAASTKLPSTVPSLQYVYKVRCWEIETPAVPANQGAELSISRYVAV